MDSGIGSIDRISNLPDSILCHIISFLPTKYAVGTSILSKRWQFLWASVPKLDFSDSLYFDRTKGLGPIYKVETSFVNFVNRVLLLTDATRFQSFRLVLHADYDFALLDTWVSAVIKRNVQIMELCYIMDSSVKLPRVVFNSKTLVQLALVQGVLLEVPASVWLPSLKILHLLGLIDNEEEHSAQKLFSGCPVLEELYIEGWTFDTRQVWNIFVPTLKRLSVERFLECQNSDEFDAEPNEPYKLVINAPKLEYLDLKDHVSDDILVEDLSSLLIAHVRGGGCMKKLITGVTNAKFLSLSYWRLWHYSDIDYVLPTFHNLIHLELSANSVPDWTVLSDFLESSPYLEVLILKRSRYYDSDICWRLPQQVPNCLLLHLKEIEIMGFRGSEHEIEMIEYMLKNAKVLKKITFDCRSSKMEEELCVWKKLKGFPRSSRTCQLDLRF